MQFSSCFDVKTITNYKIAALRKKCHVKDMFSILFSLSDLILLRNKPISILPYQIAQSVAGRGGSFDSQARHLFPISNW